MFGLGTTEILILLGAIPFSAISLRLACWITNRILPSPQPAGDGAAHIVATLVYRTVDAGPFTSPLTAQVDTPHDPQEQLAVPEPGFLGAGGIALLGIVLGVITTALVNGVILFVFLQFREPDFTMILASWAGILVSFSVVFHLLNMLLLPTTPARSLLVTFFHLLGFFLLLVGSGIVVGLAIRELAR
jgi:hypothetical protein